MSVTINGTTNTVGATTVNATTVNATTSANTNVTATGTVTAANVDATTKYVYADDSEASVSGKVLQVVSLPISDTTVAVPDYSNNKTNFRQIGTYTVDLVTKSANSRILLLTNLVIRVSTTSTHSYYDMKCNSDWVSASGQDGLFAIYDESPWATSVGVSYIYSPSVAAGTTLTFTPWVGCWAACNVTVCSYGSGNTNQQNSGQISFMEISA